jgi:hypothetical protein
MNFEKMFIFAANNTTLMFKNQFLWDLTDANLLKPEEWL